MEELSPDFKEFLELLEKHKVQYLVVGGFALAWLGHPRYTGDLDIWIRVDERNAAAMELVLLDFGFKSLQLTKGDFLLMGNIIQLGHPPVRIDIITLADGIDFDDCYQRLQRKTIGALTLPFISKEDFIRNKKASGRSQDMTDVEKLEGPS